MKFVICASAYALTLLSAIPATAATINLDFRVTGDPSLGFSSTNYALELAQTGQRNVPGFDLSVGDVVMGTVSFSRRVVVPKTRQDFYLGLRVAGRSAGSDFISFRQTIRLFNGMREVTPAGTFNIGGSGPSLFFGLFSFLPDVPAFTFDRLVYSASITGFRSGRSTVALADGTGQLEVPRNRLVAGVPEPASWAMMIGGFGLAGTALRGRATRATVRFA